MFFSTSIFAEPLRSRTRTCFTLVICFTIVSPNSILVSFSAVTRCPHGILEARQEFDGLSNTDNPINFAVSLILDFEK